MARASDDFDYSGLQDEPVSRQQPTKPIEKKSSLKDRSVIQQAKDQPSGVDLASIGKAANELQQAVGNPSIPDQVTNWQAGVLGGAGVGILSLLGNMWANKKLQAELEKMVSSSTEPKKDLRESVFKTPAAPVPEASKAPAFTGNAQPTAMPAQQPYGATTINAPTGVPGPAVPPSGAAPQPVAPAPVDPIQAARIRKAEAEAAIAEHKLQQLQAGPKTVASGKAATPGYSEAEMKMVQQGGAASASKALEAQKIAGSVAPKHDPIAATATPAEKASAVAVVEETPKTSSGMREQYHKSKKNPIGPGGFNWLSGQEGPNAQQLWEEVYGKKNVPYEQVVSDYSKAKVGPQIPRESGKPGGSFEKPKMIPEYIKGSASPAALAATAALATIPALASAGYQSYKGNKEAVDAELKDAWSSLKSAFTWPVDVAKAAGKGDFGPLKDTLMSMNPATLMLNEVSKHDEQALKRMVQAEKVGAGRGIAPPSAYQR